jgi:signal transduction histidine kinase
MDPIWTLLFGVKRSFFKRALVAAAMALLAVLIIAAVYKTTGIYFPSIALISIAIISLLGGSLIGALAALILSLICDYYFLPPPGTVLTTQEGVQHLLNFASFALVISVLNSSLRSMFHREEMAKQELEKALQSRDEMLGIISHELKNPLTAMHTGNVLIQKLLPREPRFEEIQSLVARQIPSLQRMNRLVSDLLDVTRLESKALKVLLRPADLFEIVQEVIKSYDAMAQEKLIALTFDLDADCRQVFCDRGRTVQVLANLVSNAIKFTNTGGTIHIEGRRSEGGVEVKVIDTGKGISKQNLAHVFDRFWQAKEGMQIGTGLGLAITKGLVEAQGGEIRAESELGVGTTFTFTVMSAQGVKTLQRSSASG